MKPAINQLILATIVVILFGSFGLTATYAQTLTRVVPTTSDVHDLFNDGETIAYNGDTDRIYILSDSDPRSLIIIDPATYQEEAKIPLIYNGETLTGIDSGGIGINPGTNRVYVTLCPSGAVNQLVTIDIGSRQVTSVIQLPWDNPFQPGLLLRGPIVDPILNRIFVMGDSGTYLWTIDGATNQVIARSHTTFPAGGGWWWGSTSNPNGFAINASTHRIYAANYGVFMELDATTSSYTIWPLFSEANRSSGYVGVDEGRNKVFVGRSSGITTVDGATNAIEHETLLPHYYSHYDCEPCNGLPTAMGYNPNINRAYTYGFAGGVRIAAVDTLHNTLVSDQVVSGTEEINEEGLTFYMAVDTRRNLIYSTGISLQPGVGAILAVVDPGTSQISSTGPTTTQADAATLTFENVTTSGTVSVAPIPDPSQAGEIPGGFAISESLAFEVSTSATFSGAVTTCFKVPNINVESEFLALRVLHRELNISTNQYELVDRTSAHDFADRKICATTTSFSPFYLAKVGNKVSALFDQTRAYRSGSTVPVKIKISNVNDQNISSTALPLAVRGLRLIGGSTSSTVNDAGNSNPDLNFRYDSGLQGYIYNLRTTGLASGKYALSLYAGGDRTFLHTVEFDIR